MEPGGNGGPCEKFSVKRRMVAGQRRLVVVCWPLGQGEATWANSPDQTAPMIEQTARNSHLITFN